MISPRVKTEFANILSHCLEESLRTEAHPEWHLQPVPDANSINAQRFIMLTITSYDFRLMVLLHFTGNEASKRYVADSLQVATSELPAERYDDFLGEIGNTFCGAIKRELSQYFLHLGMSTANQLRRESLKHVSSWPVDYEAHLKADATAGAEFYGSLYVSSFGDLDFDITKHESGEDTVEMGALELF